MPVAEIYERVIERSMEFDALPLITCTPADPFGIDHDCVDPTGHAFVADCADVVCVNCGRIAWQ